MVTVTLSVPEDLKKKMDEFEDVNWSAVARKAFMQRIADMEFMEKIASKSTLTEKDAIELGRKVNEGLAKRYGIKKK